MIQDMILLLLRLKLRIRKGYAFRLSDDPDGPSYWFADGGIIASKDGLCSDAELDLRRLLHPKTRAIPIAGRRKGAA